MKSTVPVPKIYSPREEALNVLTHTAGVVLFLVGTAMLLRKADCSLDMFAAIVYGASLCVLFAGSALYHRATDPERRAKLRLLDHSAIYFLIAGTYTPLMLCVERGTGEIIVLCVVWGLALLGVTLELLRIKPFKGFSILLYTLMGWACVAIMPQLLKNLSSTEFTMLFSGGIAYTVGIPFYVMRKEFCHALWHIFVIAGAVLHFLCIYLIFC